MFKDLDIQNYKVVTLPEAEEDLEFLSDFYFDVSGEESAMRFAVSAETIIESLSMWPRANAMWDSDDLIRRVNLPKHKVAVVYRVDDDYLEVIAVAAFHTLQDPAKTNKLITKRVALAQEWRNQHSEVPNPLGEEVPDA